MSKKQLTTASAVIDRLGGNRAVALLTDRTIAAVSNWRGANSIPSDTYVAMKAELAELGLEAPLALWLGKPPKKFKRSKRSREQASAA